MRLRFQSIDQVAAHARTALLRFPFVLVAGATACAAALALIDRTGDESPFIRLLLSATLGLPLFVALSATGERRGWTIGRRIAGGAAAAVVLAVFHFASDGWTDTLLMTRYVQLNVGFHLLVAVLPFVGFEAGKAFWQYNRLLLQRFLVGALFTVVLFAGLAIALLALDNLFGVDIGSKAYFRLWVVLVFVFNPWYFTGGVPADFAELETRSDYPGGLKVFAQFILIPVVSVYLLILTAYLVRVLMIHTWPSGWIGYLVSSVAAAGTLALLLVHPVREREDSRWIDAYGRWFYVVLLPSIGMLFFAIFQRLGQYGFTERRYFLLVLALWLAAIALYYGITASRHIRIIPVTLCIVALATLAGPWSAYSVSRNSQAARLTGLLEGQGLLVDGSVVRATGDTPLEVRREISATVRYLVQTHGPASVGRVAPELARVAQATADAEAGPRSEIDPVEQAITDALGVVYVGRWEAGTEDFVNYFTTPFGHPVDLAGYDVMVRLNLTETIPVRVPVGADTLEFWFDRMPATLVVAEGGTTILKVPVWPLVDRARDSRNEPSPRAPSGPRGERAEPLVLQASGNGLRLLIRATNVTGRGAGQTAELTSADADVLLSYQPTG